MFSNFINIIIIIISFIVIITLNISYMFMLPFDTLNFLNYFRFEINLIQLKTNLIPHL